MAVRRCKKVDLKRIAKATGASFITSLANLEGEESFEASSLGEAAEVTQERICDDELIMVRGTKARTAASIILRGKSIVNIKLIREIEVLLVKLPNIYVIYSVQNLNLGPNDFYCDEMERSIHDSLCVVKRVMESKNVVVGGGAVEAALSIYLENFATTLSSRYVFQNLNRKIFKLEIGGAF